QSHQSAFRLHVPSAVHRRQAHLLGKHTFAAGQECATPGGMTAGQRQGGHEHARYLQAGHGRGDMKRHTEDLMNSNPTFSKAAPDTPHAPNAMIDVRDLHVSFTRSNKTIQAVNGVSLTVRHGEALALIGESGSGKSVTLRALMRLHPPG